MIILGVDPGTLVTGYGVVETKGSGASKITMIEYGVIQSGRASSLPLRLEKIFRGLEEVIERTKPDAFAIETAFYDKNVQSTLKLGHARGVAILAAVTALAASLSVVIAPAANLTAVTAFAAN